MGPLLRPTTGGDTAAAILHAAAALFAARGYDGSSLRDIALGAGTSKANVIHHYGSKRNLYLTVMRSASDETAGLLDQLDSGPGAFAERLWRFAHNHLRNLLEHETASRLIVREMLETGPAGSRELAERIIGDNFQRLVILIRDGQQRGELRADADPATLAGLLFGANLIYFQARALLPHLPDVDFAHAPDRFSRRLIDYLLHGVGAIPAANSSRTDP